ncbi:bifunctional glycosyltransferase family 2/GtrA family protein [Fodinicola acaciae]|uniref:bifunctional glycosyltransferase family 2/GtrA family protein n=1 Tax=Fodinicola acaciae TaxID=2681555 RepID=UPI0013D10F67|nr:bifunctional glycosyltransferase family 2/GtrA family protein [Fodinicola acaciae]
MTTTSSPLPGSARALESPAGPVLDVVIPVHNEQVDLGPSVHRLHGYLRAHFPYPFRITIVDNASTDRTPTVAAGLDDEFTEVAFLRLVEKGRGRALKAAWSQSDAAVLAYMDVDLSTDLAALLPLVAPLISGHSDLAIGTRLSGSSRVVRGPKREFISRTYNLILRGTLGARFSDAQCGFKAIRQDVARQLLPMVEDTGWFFDTELLVLAQRAGLRTHEVPVDWVDDPDSRVDIVSTAIEDLKGVWRVGRGLATGAIPVSRVYQELGRAPLDPPGGDVSAGFFRQVVRFCCIGVASTAAYAVLFVLLRGLVPAQAANLLALLITAIANTAANRRLTFGIRGPRRAGIHQLQGLFVFALGLALTSGSLALLHSVSAQPHYLIELAVLVVANLVATLLRFVLLRGWVFRARQGENQ